MERDVKMYFGSFSNRTVLVMCDSDGYLVEAGACPYIFTRARANVLVKIGFASDLKTLAIKEFDLRLESVIRFCEYDGSLRFCEIDKLEPTPELKLVD